MNLTNNQSLQEMRRISVEKDLDDFRELQNIASRLDDKRKMADNIDEAKAKYNELANLYHDDFLQSSNKDIYEDNLQTMQEILVKSQKTFQDIVTIYQASTECNDIYIRFRGERIE